MNEGSRTTPTVQLSAFSLFSDGLPAIAWVNERLSDNELKFAGRPTAAQLAARVAGSGPLSRFDWSHGPVAKPKKSLDGRSEEHTSDLQSLMRKSYAVFCLKKKKK